MVQSIMAQDKIGTKRSGSHAGGRQQKYILDEPGRRLLLDRYDGTTERVTELAQRLHVPRWVVTKWAGQLSPVKKKDRIWFPEEEDYLLQQLKKKSLSAIAEDLGRTKASIRAKARKLLQQGSVDPDGYTMADLGSAFGYDPKTISRWVRLGWLKGKREKVILGDGRPGHWRFTNQDICEFIKKHPNEVDPRRADWLWLVDIMLGGDHGLGDIS